MRKGLVGKIGGTIAGIGLGVASMLYSGKAEAGMMKIESVPDKTSYSPGEPLTLNIYADSRDIQTIMINSGEWAIYNIPSWLKPKREDPMDPNSPFAFLPSSNDYFSGFTMNSGYNRVDNSISGGVLDDNVRATLPSTVGPQNKRGVLGTYYFDISSSAPQGEYFLPLSESASGSANTIFYDTTVYAYKKSRGNLDIVNNSFNITPEPSTIGFLGLGALAFGASSLRNSRKRKI